MTGEDIYILYKLHLIDAKIFDIRTRAARFDPTREIRAAIEELKPTFDAAESRYKSLVASHADLELKFKSLFDKLNNQINYLYSGKVTNPRETEAIEKDIANLRDRAEKAEADRLRVSEDIPSAKDAYDAVNKQMEKLKAQGQATYKEALAEKKRLEADYKRLTEDRPNAAQKVVPSLLAQYEAIRHKQNGLGMAEIIDDKKCGRCGTLLAAKLVLAAKDNKLVTCESCHRILYAPLPNAE